MKKDNQKKMNITQALNAGGEQEEWMTIKWAILEFMEMSAHLTKFTEHPIIQLLQQNVQNFVVYIVILNVILNKVNFSK